MKKLTTTLVVIGLMLLFFMPLISTPTASPQTTPTTEKATKAFCLVSGTLKPDSTILPPILLPRPRAFLSWNGNGTVYLADIGNEDSRIKCSGQQNGMCIGFFGIGNWGTIMGQEQFLFFGIALYSRVDAQTVE